MSRIDEDNTRVFTDHNVYILGAGFSAAAGIPVVNDFLYEMRSSLNWLSSEKRTDEFRAVSDVLKFRKNAASAALRVKLNVENIEDLFSLAAASPRFELAQSVSTAIAATINHAIVGAKPDGLLVSVKEDLDLPRNWEKKTGSSGIKVLAPLFELYAGLLSGKACPGHDVMNNTVITFNYDTVLEEALWKWNVPSWYGFEPRSVAYDKSAKKHITDKNDRGVLPILKLHGSVNWASPIGGQDKVRVYGNYADIVKAERQVLLIPPTWRKTFSGPLGGVWDAAVRALRNATRIVIIGFSIPPTDIHFKYLLAAGLQENISLRKIFCVDLNSAVENNLFTILREDLKEQRIVDFYCMRSERIFTEHTSDYRSIPQQFDRSFGNNIRFE